MNTKLSEYLPTETEIIGFFENRSGNINVYDITTYLVGGATNHSTPQDTEWRHVRNVLHDLKDKGVLIVKNEGGNIYEETFTSTPDRIRKYKTGELASNEKKGTISIVAGGNITAGGDIIAGHSNKNDAIEEKEKTIFEKVTHNPTLAIIIGALGLSLIAYFLHQLFGINLAEFKQ